ncbi:MAG: PAS domain S-box protein, partial [Acidobacteriota bacterium]
MQKTDDNRQRRLPSDKDSGIQDLIDAIPFGAQLIDSGHKIVAVNEALKKSLGMDEDQLIGQHCTVVIHNLNTPVADCPLEEAFETGKPIERELFNSLQRKWIQASVYPTRIAASDGLPIYLHFIRDITDIKQTADQLSRSLEHHKALCDLLQNLQKCQDHSQIMDLLIDQILSLSWLGMAASAVGFLMKEKNLEIVSHRNVSPELLQKCAHIAPGECLCGKAVECGHAIVCSFGNHNHSTRYEGMNEHGHAVLPIKHKGRVLGVLTLYLNPEDKMDDFKLRFLEAATSA